MLRQLIYFTFSLLTLAACQTDYRRDAMPDTDQMKQEFDSIEARLLIHFRNADSTMAYGKEMLALARKIDKPDYLGRAYNTMASGFEQLEQYDSAKHYYALAQPALAQAGDTANLALNYRGMGHTYLFQGAHELALAQYQKTIDLLAGTNDMPSLSKSYSNIGMVLMESEMHDQAIDYYRKAIDIAENEKDTILALPPLLNMSLSFLKQQQYDSAIFYAEDLKGKAAQISMDFGIGKATYILAEAYTAKGDLARADAEARLGVQIFTDLNAERDLSGLKYQRAVVLHQMGNERKALRITDEMLGKNLLEALKVDVLELRADIYQSLGDNAAALQAYKTFVKAYKALSMRESEQLIIQQQFKFDTEQKLQQIKDLQTDATITALRLDQQRTRLYIALASIFVLIISAYLLFTRHKIRSRQEVMQLQNKLLRTQLNPHFLFNAMGAIQQYIYSQEDPQLISDYLGRFSRLTRMILNYSKQELITLEEELDFLKNYIALQQIRFEVPFEFNLKMDSSVEADQLLVPPMLTQPFIENAIEHGFLHKEGQGHINLTIEETKEQLLITVEDDGIGRTQAATLAKKTRHESLATKITIERLKLIQKKMRQKSELLIKDLMDQQNHVTGTRVQLNIPLIKD
jgi:tetratricopeptide (TPR) repeat protein